MGKNEGKIMKLSVFFDAFVYKKKETPWELKDGTKGVTKKLLLDQNDSVDEFRTTEDIYEEIKSGSNYRFTAFYDTDKGYFSISGYAPLGGNIK